MQLGLGLFATAWLAPRGIPEYLETHKVQQRIQNLIQVGGKFYMVVFADDVAFGFRAGLAAA